MCVKLVFIIFYTVFPMLTSYRQSSDRFSSDDQPLLWWGSSVIISTMLFIPLLAAAWRSPKSPSVWWGSQAPLFLFVMVPQIRLGTPFYILPGSSMAEMTRFLYPPEQPAQGSPQSIIHNFVPLFLILAMQTVVWVVSSEIRYVYFLYYCNCTRMGEGCRSEGF